MNYFTEQTTDSDSSSSVNTTVKLLLKSLNTSINIFIIHPHTEYTNIGFLNC